MQSFHIYLDLYNGSGIIDSIVINGGGMGLGGGTRKGTYTTKVQSNGTWKIRSVVVESTTYTADQFFNTLGGRFAYGKTEPTGTAGKNNGVGNYYHILLDFGSKQLDKEGSPESGVRSCCNKIFLHNS